MSIYPVHLKEWFPRPTKSDKEYKDKLHWWQSATSSVKYSECLQCGKKKMNYRYAWGHHSIPWGNGDIWCGKRCLRKGYK